MIAPAPEPTQQKRIIDLNAPERIDLFRHQRQLVRLPFERPAIQNFFLVGGYGSGKSSADLYLITRLIEVYYKYQIKIAIFGITLTLLKKTLIADLINIFIRTGTAYRFDRQANLIYIGAMIFVLIGMEQPQDIFAHNVCASIGDEIDELEQTKAMEANTAIQERTRVTFPDGRPPFVCYSTTAQGYRGTYQIIEQLKETRTPYVHIRGLTKDNTANDPSYYNNLYKIYNENERAAFLEGKFVNLSTGRVYPGYDESINMVPDFPIEPMETIHVGQDLNTGFSKGVAMVVRDGKIYMVKEWSFKEIGHAARIIRNDFPTQRILWYPDASGKEIMTGYLAEIREAGIELRLGTINPSVLDRIFIVNKLFEQSRSFIFRSLRMLPMAMKTRQYNNQGDPEKGSGENAPDHVADSLEYSQWRIVSSMLEFRDIFQTTRSYANQKKVGQR